MTSSKMLSALTAAGLASTLAACATIEEAAADAANETYYANLTGAQEVGPGDPDGSAKARITIADDFDQVCWDVSDIRNIGPVTAAHIHFGPAGTNGPPVFPLRKANEGTWTGCAAGAEWTQNRLQGNPEAFYVNLHTAEYPNGAIRGQLRR